MPAAHHHGDVEPDATFEAAARDGGVGLNLDDAEFVRRIDAYWWSPIYPELIAG